MIVNLAYVRCDRCGAPAGGTDDLRETGKSAKDRARQLGFRRVHTSQVLDMEGELRMVDLCKACFALAVTR